MKGLAWLIVVGFCFYASHLLLAGNWMAAAGLGLPAGLGGR